MIKRVLTIGAYGFSERAFMQALIAAGADLFVDIRARRGMRGADYAFANSQRLQASLQAAGIRYVHAKELAPSDDAREAQRAADAASGTAKRDRRRLATVFVAAYERECLSTISPEAFAAKYANGAERPVLFCVERDPAACHRSLVARWLAEGMAVPVQDLEP